MAIFRCGRSDQNRAGGTPTLWYRELAGVLLKKGVAADEGLLIEVPLRLYASR
jgi:hypothetical protein